MSNVMAFSIGSPLRAVRDPNGITAENILSTLPPALSEDPKMRAIASSIATQLQISAESAEIVDIYGNVGSLPDGLLDILASDLNIPWYDASLPIESKRKIILSSWIVHKGLGTVGAVKEGLRNVYPDANIEEWFDYGGDPFHYKVALDAGDNFSHFDTEIVDRTMQFLDYYRNIRSHIDSIVIASRRLTQIYVGACVHVGSKYTASVPLE